MVTSISISNLAARAIILHSCISNKPRGPLRVANGRNSYKIVYSNIFEINMLRVFDEINCGPNVKDAMPKTAMRMLCRISQRLA